MLAVPLRYGLSYDCTPDAEIPIRSSILVQLSNAVLVLIVQLKPTTLIAANVLFAVLKILLISFQESSFNLVQFSIQTDLIFVNEGISILS